MKREFTKGQQQAIDLRGKNILVSAAAGSGKTAVLVERIIRLISEGEHPADIDRLLVVTFTAAAAGEMKERIEAAIAEKLALTPENEHLQRQSALIHNAQITTIHSFCLFVIRNHFQEIGLDPAFRVADEGEVGLLQQEVLEEVMEEAFGKMEKARGKGKDGIVFAETEQERADGALPAETESGFQALVEAYGTGKKETVLEETVLSLHRFAMSCPWPFTWLKEHGEDYEISSPEELEQSLFMRYIMGYLGNVLPELAAQLRRCIGICEEPDGPYMYGQNLEESLAVLERAVQAGTYRELQAALERVRFDRLSSKRDDTVDPQKRELVKSFRSDVKKQLEQIKEQFLGMDEEALFAQCRQVSPVVRELAELTIRFGERFEEKKREKNLIDFSDMEHLALRILCRRQETEEGVRVEPTAAALELREHFQEIMIDEYQDSNLVQECILGCISGESAGRYDRFMVGDVKQSIYKFRLARPELFMEKFHGYAGGSEDLCRIDLHRNFRSRREVLESVNLIFSQLMDRSLGGIDYDEGAKLHYGAVYYDEATKDEKDQNRTEFFLIERQPEEEKSAARREAEAIALRIRGLMREMRVLDEGGKGMRPLRYGDIVILLRSDGGLAETFAEVLAGAEIPCHVNSRTGYFRNQEVQVVLQLLRVLDNPLQDIPLFGVLRSCFCSFTDVEVAKIVAAFPERRRLYKKIRLYAEKEDETAKKCRAFLSWHERLRKQAVWLSVRELLAKIMEETHYPEYVTAMPEGERRRANVQMLLQKAAAFEKTNFKGIYHFVRYIDRIEKYEIEQGEAGTVEDAEDAVRIMTIHKSKGLEFPVCFVAGMGRKMNRRDASVPVLFDMDMGIGVDQVDPLLRVKRRTLRKAVLSRKILADSQAEELRVLYVALTRAKEKLIITGVVENAEKLLQGKAWICAQEERVLPYRIRSGGGNFLELLAACLMRTESMGSLLRECGVESLSGGCRLEGNVICKILREEDMQAEVLAGAYREINDMESFKRDLGACVVEDKVKESLQKRFGYRYPHESLQKLYPKTTVSELKMAAIRDMAGRAAAQMPQEGEEAAKHLFEEEVPVPYLPRFLKRDEEKEKISGAARGSAMHRVMELMDFAVMERGRAGERDCFIDYGGPELERDLETWCRAGLLSREYREAVSRKKILRFLKSEVAGRMHRAAKAGKLWKEQPFMIGISADRLSPEFPDTEEVLVQGIIDVFFEEDGEIVLLDYKTDVIKSPQELADRYLVQLDYYGEALSRMTGKRVKERVLYSFYLGDTVWV